MESKVATGACSAYEEKPEFEYSGSNAISLYLKTLRAIPPLREGEELALAEAITAGREAATKLDAVAAGTLPCISSVEERDLQTAMANGRSAQQRMTEAHLPLVVYAVKKSATDTLPLLDIIQEGNLILMKFVANFHYAAGVSFRSRLMLCLRGAETAARQKARSVRISGPMSTCIMKLGRVSRCLWQARGHNPSQEEIAHEMNFTVGMTQQIAEAAELNKTPTSLDVPIGEDAAVCLGDCIADENCPDPVQLVLRGLMREQVDDVLNSLTPEERAVIRLRFGFLDECPRTVQEVSAALHTTNSHVQKVEITAMRKLRHPSRSRRLQGFLK